LGYVFYDTETSGLNTRHDEILQFAAIVTDAHFEEQERFEIKLRLSPHVIPSPKALFINDTPLAECFSSLRASQFDGMAEIHAFIPERSPATFAGWNSIGFDEEIIRHSFYRQLLGAFPTSLYGNARMDIMSIARATDALRSGSITIQHGDDGKKSFKLQNVCAANGYKPRVAHEAMSDVEACLYLARLIHEREPEIWSAFAQTSRKNSAMEIVKSKSPCVVVTGWKDYTRSFVGVEIGCDPKLSMYSYVLDLSAPLPDFNIADHDACAKWFNQTPAPIIKIRCNASPMIIPIDDLEEYDDVVDDLTLRASEILANTNLTRDITNAFCKHIDKEQSNTHVEEMLYDGFPVGDTDQIMTRFREVDWSDRLSIAQQFPDARYRKFAMRILAEHTPELMEASDRVRYQTFIAARQHSEDSDDFPWMSLSRAKNQFLEIPEHCREVWIKQFAETYKDLEV